MIRTTLEPAQLAGYVSRQAGNFFPDGTDLPAQALLPVVEKALERLQRSFVHIRDSRYHKDGCAYFNHLHSDQYASFLYVLANQAWKDGMDPVVSSKLYLLNKALHALDVFYEVELPEIFLLGHPVGTVLGRAQYGSRLVVMQNCTVGNRGNRDENRYPIIGKGVVLGSSSVVLGASVLEDEVCVGAGTLLIDQTISKGSTVVGRGPDQKTFPSKYPRWQTYFLD